MVAVTNPYTVAPAAAGATGGAADGEAAEPAPRDKLCEIHVHWVSDPSETGERARGLWRAPVTVSFANGLDLVRQNSTYCCKWHSSRSFS
jgi:hypothetical protein